MEIKKLRFKNRVWQCMNQGAKICVCKNADGSYHASYEKNGKNLTCLIKGEDVEVLEEKLTALNIHTWKTEYYEPVCDGETWSIEVTFTNNEEKSIQGSNGYPENWKEFLYLYYWVAQCCEDAEDGDRQSVNVSRLTDYDIWELDRKFELLDSETASAMTGTGSELD